MSNRTKILGITLGVVLLAGILIGGVVLAQETGPVADPAGHTQAFVARVAQILGLEEEGLTGAFTQAAQEMVQQAVEDGRITQEQAVQMLERVEQGGFNSHGFRMDHGWSGGDHHEGALHDCDEGDHAEGEHHEGALHDCDEGDHSEGEHHEGMHQDWDEGDHHEGMFHEHGATAPASED